jgi:L-threonylcarbamoyladenylate synthase
MTTYHIDQVTPDPKVVAQVAGVVAAAGVIIYPTETIYGLGGNGQDPAVIERIYDLKGRDRGKAMSLIIDSTKRAESLAAEIPEPARALMKAFWPGPLTVVFKASANVPEALSGPARTVALRISSNPFCTELSRAADCPLIATSANPSGGGDNCRVDTIPRSLLAQVDAVVDGGATEGTVPSTVIDMVREPGRVLRPGSIPADRIETVLKG